MSVCQGSTLSGLLYLIYTLDLPLVQHSENHSLHDYENCKNPKTTTFVDDSAIKISLSQDQNIHNGQIKSTLDVIYDYMNANKLVLNQSKSKILIISQNPAVRQKISINVPGRTEPLIPSRSFTYLGIPIQDTARWNFFIQESSESLIKGLTNRINAIKKLRNVMTTKLTKTIINGVFMSKLLYGAPLWVGAPKYLVKKVQKLQLDAARLALGTESARWSTNKLLKNMKWLPVKSLLEKASIKMLHSMIHMDEPPMMAYRILKKYQIPDQHTTRMSGPGKLGAKPPKIGNTVLTKYQFRAAAYRIYAQLPTEITDIKSTKRFMHWVKKFMTNPKNIPKTKPK